MVLEERARQEPLDRLEHVLGARHAQTLMAYLPPLEAAHVATVQDVAGVRAELQTLRGDVDQWRAEVEQWQAQVDQWRAQVDQWRAQVDQRFVHVDHRFDLVEQRFQLVDQSFHTVLQRIETAEQRIETAEQRVLAAVRGEVNTLVTTQTRVLVLGLLGAFTAQTGVLLVAVRLMG